MEPLYPVLYFDYMKVCIDARMLQSSGIGTFLKNLIGPLSAEPFSTSLIQHSMPIYSIKEQYTLPFLISPCEVFWSPHYNIPLLPIRAKTRIVTIHDACHLALQNTLGWKERLYAKIMLSQAIARSDVVITDSYFSRTELCRFLSVSPNRIQVIYPGVNTTHFSQNFSESQKEDLRKKYSLPPSFFLFVGNIKPHKNLRLLADCYKRFSLPHPLVVIGKMSGLLNPDRTIDASAIQYVGEVTDPELPLFYQLATALVFPSLYEGFGLPPLEAMAAGCPTIVSNRASLPEACGDAAYYIDPSNPDELVSAMREVGSNPIVQAQLREKGLKQSLRFSWTVTAENYRNIFQHFARESFR